MSSVALQLREFANKGHEVVLPASGITVLFKRLDLPDLAAKGILPTILLQKALSGFPDLDSPDAKETDILAAIAEMQRFAAIVIANGLVSPRLVEENPAEDEITLSDLVEEDRNALMSIAQMPVKQWETFLRSEGARLSSVDDGEKSTV